MTASLAESLKLAQQFAEKGPEHAIQLLLHYYKSHVNPDQARKAKEIADHRAKQGSNSSIDYLIHDPDESNKENFFWKWWYGKQAYMQPLSEHYAFQGHESAIQHIFENANSKTPSR